MNEILINTLAIIAVTLPFILAPIARGFRPGRHFRLHELWVEELKKMRELSVTARTPLQKVAAQVMTNRFSVEVSKEAVPFVGSAILYESLSVLSSVMIGLALSKELAEAALWSLIYWVGILVVLLIGIFAKSALQDSG
ncbi:hypothetical protein [Lysinibacter cavernae]|uniref:hypothetical protein n=1 Tax=Lysinibacter cavernae TaxID=1640652 RepID=UPI003613E8C7